MDSTVPLDPTVTTLVFALILPMLTGLVTRKLASSQIKSLVLMFLSILVSAGQALFGLTAFDVKTFVATVLLQFLFATAVHFGLLKPAGVTGSQGVIQENVTGGVG